MMENQTANTGHEHADTSSKGHKTAAWKVGSRMLVGAAMAAAVFCAFYYDVSDPRTKSSNDMVLDQGLSGFQSEDAGSSVAGLDVPLSLQPLTPALAARGPMAYAQPPLVHSRALSAAHGAFADPADVANENLQRRSEHEDDEEVVRDSRYTPIWLFVGYDIHSDVSLQDLLGEHSKPKHRISCYDAKHDEAARCSDHRTKVYTQVSAASVPGSIIIMCKSWISVSPCDDGDWSWKTGSHFIWLTSIPLCGEPDKHHTSWDKRCPGTINIQEMELPDTRLEEHVKGEKTYLGRLGLDTIYLYNMLFAVDELLGGNAINKETLQHLRAQLAEEEEREWQHQQSELVGDLEWSSEMTVAIIGESIAERIGGMFKEQLENSMHCVSQKLDDNPFPHMEVVNAAKRGQECTNYFLPCTSDIPSKYWSGDGPCAPENAKTRASVLNILPSTQPDVVVIHDTTWSTGRGFDSHERRNAALSNALKAAMEAGTKEFFWMTASCVGHNGPMYARRELSKLDKFVEDNRCKSGDKHGIAFTIFDWHLLTCPTYASFKCPHRAHGFYDILPDENHPSGPAGEWLTGQALAAITASVAQHRLKGQGYQGWQKAIENPVSSCMLQMQPPDNEPPLKDLSRRFFVCPK